MAPPPDGANEVAAQLGDEAGLRLLQELVSIAPTNFENLALGKFDKSHYGRAAEAIVRWARSFGLSTRIYDPLVHDADPERFGGIPRPNVLVDLDRGAPETVLVLGHYDVIPVPEEQRARWRSPPHTLTLRPDGRLYGRGANDDLGSGITATLLAMRHLAERDGLPRNVRLLACCDEETGGQGGIESLRDHDARLDPGDPERFLVGDVALIPDGSPHVTAGSSGLAFLEASFEGPVALSSTLAYGEALRGLHTLATSWASSCASPDWPDRDAPAPVITGRATVTRWDVDDVGPPTGLPRLLAAHAETEASNLIARAVTLVFGGSPESLSGLTPQLSRLLPAPFTLEPAASTSLQPPPEALALQVVGRSGHAGYPHRARNPVPPALELLARATAGGLIDGTATGAARFTVDYRLIPELELDAGVGPALARIRSWAEAHAPSARIDAPASHARPGYLVSPEHPSVRRLAAITKETLGTDTIYGEYGGTDASTLRGLTTPRGEPLPAIVFGSMDVQAQIHDVDESADPRLIAAVSRTIERFVREP